MPTLVQAIRAKYEHEQGSQDGGELVGGDKTGRKQALDVLTRVFVPGEQIDDPGPDGEVSSVCGSIAELDLGGNLLSSWAPLQAIAKQLPKLHWLGLDRTPLEPLASLPDGFGAAFGGLRTLCVSSTGMAWGQLLFLAGATPALEELHFGSNGVTSLQPPEASAALPLLKVHSLYLEGNALGSWEAVAPLGALPELRVLNLNHNQLREVPALGPESKAFRRLAHLMLRANPIDGWATVDAVGSFPALTEARLADLPLTASISGAAARRTIIARIGALKALNGSEVRVRERDDAERFYLRQVAQEYPEGGLPANAVVTEAVDLADDAATAPAAAPLVDEYGRPLGGGAPAGGGPPKPSQRLELPPTEEWAALQARHPRWATLLLKHGTHVTASGGGGGGGGVLANELVEITMRATSAEAAHLPAATRKLPGGLPLKSVKLIACQLFKVEPTRMQLLYCPPGQERDIPELLEDDTKSLADLGVVSGGTIVVEESEA